VRKSAQWLLGLLISILALVFVFRNANLTEVWGALRQAHYVYALPALGFCGLALAARALSWQAVLGGGLPFRRVFAVINEGYLLNNVLPFRLGEVARAYLISRGEAGPSAAQGLSSVLVERLIDLVVVVSMLAAFLPLTIGLTEVRQTAALAVLLGIAALAGLVVLAYLRPWVLRGVHACLGRVPFPGFKAAAWEARARSFLDGLAALQDVRRSGLAAFWSAVAWVATAFSAWVWLLAFLPGATLPMGFLALLLTTLAGALPSLPSAVGVFESAIVVALAVFKVDENLALSFAVTLHLLHFGLTCTLGGLALAREGETLAHLAQAAQALVLRPPAADDVV
jgi:hypothetical protein